MAIRRFDGANWIDCSSIRRFDGANWIDCSSIKRWDGANWVECLINREQIMNNFSHFEVYVHSLEKYGEFGIYPSVYHDSSRNWWDFSSSNSVQDTKLYLRFRAVTKGSGIFNVDSNFLNLIDAKTSIRIFGSLPRHPTNCRAYVRFGNLNRGSSSSESTPIDGRTNYITETPEIYMSFKSPEKNIVATTEKIELELVGNDNAKITPLTMCVERY